MKTTFLKINEGDFYEVINEAKKKGRHVDYLEKVLKDYDEYKTFFEVIFSDKNSPNDVYFFKVNYLLKKPVWREIAILGRQTFRDLAEAIIYSMDWENDHMHGFNLPKDEDLDREN